MAPYKLTYFAVNALNTPMKWMMDILNIKYVEDSFSDEDWPKIKPTTPFGTVPVLEIDGKKVYQSASICRYFGKKAGLNGATEWEDLQIDMAVDTFTDFRLAVGNWHYEEDENAKEKKFGPLMNETVPLYLKKFDELIKKNNGYLANGKLSWGDIYVVGLFVYLNGILKFKITENHPHIKELEEKVLEFLKSKKA